MIVILCNKNKIINVFFVIKIIIKYNKLLYYNEIDVCKCLYSHTS